VLNVLIADSQDTVQETLMPLLQAEFGELLVHEVRNSNELLGGVKDGKWDVIVLDVLMPGQDVVEILKQVRQRDPKMPVLIITDISEARHVLRARMAGVAAMAQSTNDRLLSRHKALSAREYQVFCLIAQGKTIKGIAYDLLVSAKTVATYLARIKEKTGFENHVDIARYAFQNRLVK
jgi:DNA-binding NarL/FixJ family response regulator